MSAQIARENENTRTIASRDASCADDGRMTRIQADDGLTDEDIAREEEFLSGIPRFNIGAFLLPGIWGPGHGLWVCILFYPLWMLADNVFFGAYIQRSAMAVTLAAIVFAVLTLVHVVFGVLSQPYAWHKAAERNVSKETYLKRERIWTVAMIAMGIAALAVATYYNVQIRPSLGY